MKRFMWFLLLVSVVILKNECLEDDRSNKVYMDDDDIFLSCNEDMGLCEGFCKIDIVNGMEKNNCYDFFFYEDASYCAQHGQITCTERQHCIISEVSNDETFHCIEPEHQVKVDAKIYDKCKKCTLEEKDCYIRRYKLLGLLYDPFKCLEKRKEDLEKKPDQ